MKLSTKITIITLEAAIIPWVIGGYNAFSTIKEEVERTTFVGLDTSVEIQKKRLEDVIKHKLELLSLFTTSSKLLATTQAFMVKRTPLSREAMEDALQEEKGDVEGIKNIFVTDTKGIVIASFDQSELGQDKSAEDFFKRGIQKPDGSALRSEGSGGAVLQYVAGPLRLTTGETLGVIVMVVDADDIVAVTKDFIGLGKSGETLLVKDDGNGNVQFLTPTRFAPNAPSTLLILKERRDVPSVRAIAKEEGVFRNMVDYREESVIAATRYIESTEWGIVLKVDQSEAYGAMHKLRDLYFSIIALISLLMIFVGISIARSITGPIKNLTVFAEKIAGGDLRQSIIVSSKDEVGVLGGAFNKMLVQLNESYETLEQKVADRTASLMQKTKEAEDNQKAAFNIAMDLKTDEEDLAIQKMKAENLANDLKKFKLALDNASDQVIISDPQGTVVYANPAVEKITGFKPEEAVGKKAGALWKSPMPKEYYENLWHVLQVEKRPFLGEIQNKRKNGQLYTAMIGISPVLDNKGDPLFYVGIERDITKEKEMDKAKSEFISLASHQMRTPLTIINWYSEMLLGGDAGKLSERQGRYFEEIYGASQQMNDILKSFLHILRIETGKQATNLVSTDLLNIMRKTLKELELDIQKKNIHIVEQYQDSLPLPVTDSDLLHVIIQNLLSNAVKYTPEKGTVTVTLQKADAGSVIDGKTIGQDSLLISVQDTGIGIPVKDQDKIFGKFFRSENAVKNSPNGNGLGLYMTKIMADIIGNTVWFSSEEGKGTTFFLLVPKETRMVV